MDKMGILQGATRSIAQDRHFWRGGRKTARVQGMQYNDVSKSYMIPNLQYSENITNPKITP